MLGYMAVRREELRIREFDRYRAYYCGLCHAIGRRCGAPARLALSFEMTFLAMLLTALYEDSPESREARCLLHPVRKRSVLASEAIDYCADLSAMVSYYDLRDGWEDEKNPGALAGSAALLAAAKRAGAHWPRQREAVERYVRDLHALERSGDATLDAASRLTGAMLAELYVFREDIYAPDLRVLGDAVGRFISFCDSYEDVERDEKRSNYNPLIPLSRREGFAADCEAMLSGMIAPGAEAFERLPILEDAEILRNILYSGVWLRFERATQKQQAKKESE